MGSLDLAGAVVATSAAGMVEIKVPMCLGVVLIYLGCVGTRLSLVLDEFTAPAEEQFGPSAV